MKRLTAVAAALLCAAPALTHATLIDFEAPSSFASIDQFYNGGTDSAGASGPNLGVSFGLDALAVANDALGPYFSNAPSPLGVMTAVGPAATVNVAGGFSSLVSFYYASTAALSDAVQVWSGLDGTGTLLASFNLAANAQGNGCSDTAFCNFGLAQAAISGTGHSITFGNAANIAAFDDLTVPEPSSLLLAGLALAGLVARRRRG